MAAIVYKAIHGSPLKNLKYVSNGEKTDECKFVTGVNCSSDPEKAYEDMKDCFENFSGERFWKKSLFLRNEQKDKSSKEQVRLHHYMQSFKPGEVSPEEAHQIGVEWAKKCFGENAMVLIATHVDKGHIHNHFSLCPYDENGKHWTANKKSLNELKVKSNEITKAHGLSVIEFPQDTKNKYNHKYGEWRARKENRSWKQKLCEDIDKIVLQSNVHNIDDFAEELRKMNYIVTVGKYISVKPANAKKNTKAIRTYRLGDGYFREHLEYRIAHKNVEMSFSDISRYSGIQKEYAMVLRQLQMMKYREAAPPKYVSYKNIMENVNVLNFLAENNIHSVEQLKNEIENSKSEAENISSEKSAAEEKLKLERKIVDDFPKFMEIISRKPMIAKDREELKQYQYLLDMKLMKQEDFQKHIEILSELEKKFSEMDENEKLARERNEQLDSYMSSYSKKSETYFEKLLQKAENEKIERDMSFENYENKMFAETLSGNQR